MKASILFAVLLIATVVQAANVTLTPATVYETTTAWQTIDVNNYKSNSIITKVAVNSPNLQITNAATYNGWATSQDSDSAEWKNGTIETNMKSAIFEFEVSAPNVTSDTTTTATISLDSSSTQFNITILNDATPPNITDIRPNGYARANSATQTVSATVTDAETGVADAKYKWNNCSGSDTTITLTQNSNTYSGIANFSSYNEGSTACYTITARNNAGETATTTGQLLFDGTAPSVSIVAPTAFALESTNFQFNATDNLATTLTCDLYLGNTLLETANVTNGTTTTMTEDLSSFTEGSHTWSVTCTDGVGLSATKAQSIILDTQPPVITLNFNPFILRTQSTQFTTTVTDTIGVANVNSTFDGNAVTLTKNGNDYTGTISSNTLGTKTLTIDAVDDVGHTATKTQTITIVPNHQLTLTLSPSQAIPGTTITASGTLTTDGNVTSTSVTVKTTSGDNVVNLDSNNDYSTTFTAPSPGTYTITTEYSEAGYTYTAQATLTTGQTSTQNSGGSNGYDSSWSGAASYVKPEEQPQEQSDSEGNNQITQEETPPQQTPPPAEYTPLPPEEPREAITPKATGIFNLGKNIKWLALLLALGLLGGLGTYAYKKRPPKGEGSVNWDGYFDGP